MAFRDHVGRPVDPNSCELVANVLLQALLLRHPTLRHHVCHPNYR